MSDILQVKYLLHGTLEIVKPSGWDEMDFETQKKFVDDTMLNTDPDILMYNARPEETGCVDVQAVVNDEAEAEYELLTALWEDYVFRSDSSCKLYPAHRRKGDKS